MIGGYNAVLALLGVTGLLGSITNVASQNVCDGVTDSANDICCVGACGTCGGAGCGLIPGTNGPSDCCVTEIWDSGVMCSETVGAPCILSAPESVSNSTCPGTDVAGLRDPVEDVCCPAECGECGGEGCGRIPGTTANECCASNIMMARVLCSESGEAPCIIDQAVGNLTSTCSNGFPGIEDSVLDVCCSASCGVCGGQGCGNIPGTGGASDCCSSTIATEGSFCDETGAAPCIMNFDFVPSTCANGLSGVGNGDICCAESCNGQCGGVGCGSIPGTNGPSDCCTEDILDSGVFCEPGVLAPCIMIEGTFTQAPTASPSMVPTMSGTLVGTMVGTMMGTDSPTAAPTMIGGTFAPTADVMMTTFSPTSSDTETPGSREISGASSAVPTSTFVAAVTALVGVVTSFALLC
ncbi:unnamed protein product [Choristocarpus tenellus]